MYDKRNYSVYSYTDLYDEKSCMRLNPVKQRNMLAFCKQYDSNNKKRFIHKTYTRILVQIVKVETVSNFNNFF